MQMGKMAPRLQRALTGPGIPTDGSVTAANASEQKGAEQRRAPKFQRILG